MEIDEYLKYRTDLLAESEDEQGFITDSGFLKSVISSMVDSKVVESEDFEESYYLNIEDKIKLNGYAVTESGERLLLFLVNEDSIRVDEDPKNIQVSQKAYYDGHFNRAIKFIQNSIAGKLNDELQDSDGVKALVSKINSSEGLDQFDVIEIFLISATATVDLRSAVPEPKTIIFDHEKVKVKFSVNRKETKKEIIVAKRLIDLNYLYGILISQGNREPLTVDFEKFNYRIEAIKAADEQFFESYLCVFPGGIIADLYKEYSTRMLEKNVRSFLQFPKKGVNNGMKNTILAEPEKFIAYNNGLTITSTGKDIVEENGKFYIKALHDFQIVNGGQTTATIYFSQKEGMSIDQVKVMAKINIAKNASEEELETLITNISNYSNAQTKVSKVDLRARSPQLIRIKSLSESVVTPKGHKWFFERAKGELNTAIRKSGRKEKILKKFPKERRFSKEDLAKYYTAWGNRPYVVKLGGEKVFRDFIEGLTADNGKKKPPVINRAFFENIVAKTILFRTMERIYGSGLDKIGNLRAAVIPYSLSVLFELTDGASTAVRFFDFDKIWMKDGLEEDLSDYLRSLMKLMNRLIKKYATSDDLSENSKTQELWHQISESKEIEAFNAEKQNSRIVTKYSITKEDHKKRIEKEAKRNEVDFKLLEDNVAVHANGVAFYQKLPALFSGFSSREKEVIAICLSAVHKHTDLSEAVIEQEKNIIQKLIAECPEVLDQVPLRPENYLYETLDFLVESYNTCINNDQDTLSVFKSAKEEFKSKGFTDVKIWDKLALSLADGECPGIGEIVEASVFISGKVPLKKAEAKVKITEELLQSMLTWEADKKLLSAVERGYITEFAYGFKKLNAFHEDNCLRHLQKLQKNGFSLS
jgi:hypothetical protein